MGQTCSRCDRLDVLNHKDIAPLGHSDNAGCPETNHVGLYLRLHIEALGSMIWVTPYV